MSGQTQALRNALVQQQRKLKEVESRLSLLEDENKSLRVR
jgi:hypothetical protein